MKVTPDAILVATRKRMLTWGAMGMMATHVLVVASLWGQSRAVATYIGAVVVGIGIMGGSEKLATRLFTHSRQALLYANLLAGLAIQLLLGHCSNWTPAFFMLPPIAVVGFDDHDAPGAEVRPFVFLGLLDVIAIADGAEPIWVIACTVLTLACFGLTMVRVKVAREAFKVAEEGRLRLEQAQKELEASRERYRMIAESTNAVPFALSLDEGRFTYVGPQASRFGYPIDAWSEPDFLERLLPRDSSTEVREQFEQLIGSFELECGLTTPVADQVTVRWVVSASPGPGPKLLHGLMLDITEQRRLEHELAAAQKLESLGRLATGVAHEINTPVQFVSDSLHFVRSALDDIGTCFTHYRELKEAVIAGNDTTELSKAAAEAEEACDLEYAIDKSQPAVERALEGLGRVATIVRSLKQFAHPDGKSMTNVALNPAIQATLTIAHNEYKYVADVVTELGELPQVLCHVGEINQVVLNLVVNASHAIADKVKGTNEKGKITVRTQRLGDHVEISIADNGGGIPLEIRNRIYDPFFTTKEVGRGTGQGLAIARSMIDKHHGKLSFESEVGKGTTFFIRLPIDGGASQQQPTPPVPESVRQESLTASPPLARVG